MTRRRALSGALPPGAYFPDDAAAPPSPASPAPASPASPAGESFEAWTKTIDSPRGKEQTIYETTKPWQGIDVYLAVRVAVPPSSVFTVRVYAIVGGVKALVASGRHRFIGSTAGAFVQPPPELVCSARAGAVKYEVTIFWLATAGVNDVQPVDVAIYASDRLTVEPPKFTGAPIAFGGNNTTSWDDTTGGAQLYPGAEIRSIVAFNSAAAARYVLLIETDPATAVGAGFVATETFPIGALAGQGAAFDDVRYRVRPGRRMRIFASSTGPTLTAVGDASFTVRVA